eukprot:389361-Amphidinium_carterae.1
MPHNLATVLEITTITAAAAFSSGPKSRNKTLSGKTIQEKHHLDGERHATSTATCNRLEGTTDNHRGENARAAAASRQEGRTC